MEFINGVTMRVHKHKSRQINIKNGVLAGTANLPTLHCQFADIALPICRHSKVRKVPIFGVTMRVHGSHQKMVRYCKYCKYRSARVPLRLLLPVSLAAYPLELQVLQVSRITGNGKVSSS